MFELYLQDSKGKMINVPVLINQTDGLSAQPSSDWKLNKRFFIFDTLTGVDKDQAQGKPSYVRWASDVKLKVQMDPEGEEKIYRPYLVISYKAIEAKLISETTALPASLTIEYFSDFSGGMNLIVVFFIIWNIVALLVTLVRFLNFTKRNPSAQLKGESKKFYPAKFVFYLFDVWSDLMFWLLFFVCTVVYFNYKINDNAKFVLYELGDAASQVETPFFVVFSLVLVLKFVAVVLRILEQTRMDVFLIDNERPNRQTGTVNAWRQYFVANQFSEVQNQMRYVQPETLFIWFLFFWVGLGW